MGVESGSSVSRDIRGGGMGKFHHLYENIRLRYDTATVKNLEEPFYLENILRVTVKFKVFRTRNILKTF